MNDPRPRRLIIKIIKEDIMIIEIKEEIIDNSRLYDTLIEDALIDAGFYERTAIEFSWFLRNEYGIRIDLDRIDDLIKSFKIYLNLELAEERNELEYNDDWQNEESDDYQDHLIHLSEVLEFSKLDKDFLKKCLLSISNVVQDDETQS